MEYKWGRLGDPLFLQLGLCILRISEMPFQQLFLVSAGTIYKSTQRDLFELKKWSGSIMKGNQMAYALSRTSAAIHSLEAVLQKVRSTIVNFWVSAFEAQAHTNKFEEMSNLTDKELAEKYGISRDQIIGYIYSNKYNL